MKNPFRQEVIRSQLTPQQVISRLRERSIPYESIVNWNAPMEGYATFVTESFSGDREVVAKIEGNDFQLMPIGIWPVKGKTGHCVGALRGSINTEGSGSRIHLWYWVPWYVTIFLPSSFLFTCLFSLLLATIDGVAEDDRWTHLGFIFGFPACALLFAIGMVAPAWPQSEMLRRFLREIVEEDSQTLTMPEVR